MSLSVQEVFNLLSADPKFVAKLEASVKNIMKDGKIDQYDVPELVFIITDSYNEMSRFRLTYDELPQLIKMIYNFMVEKLNLIPEDKRSEFDRLVDSALRLVMMQPVVKQAVTSCFSKIFPCCFRTEAEEPKPVAPVAPKPEPEKKVEEQKLAAPEKADEQHSVAPEKVDEQKSATSVVVESEKKAEPEKSQIEMNQI